MQSSSANDFHKLRLAEERKIFVYYLPLRLQDGSKKFFYLAASALLHEQFLKAVAVNQIPDFAVVVGEGDGEPDDEIKNKMRFYYNFDHEVAEDFLLPPKSSMN